MDAGQQVDAGPHTTGTVEAGQGLPLIPNSPTAKASQSKAHRALLKVTQLLTGRTSTCLITQTSPCFHGRAPSGDVYTNDNHPEIPPVRAELIQVHGENLSRCPVPGAFIPSDFSESKSQTFTVISKSIKRTSHCPSDKGW